MTVSEIKNRLLTLTVLRGAARQAGCSALISALSADNDFERAGFLADYAAALAPYDFCPAAYFTAVLCEAENPYAEKKCRGQASAPLLKAVTAELEVIAALCALPQSFFEGLFTDKGLFACLPVFADGKSLDTAAILKSWENGCGAFSKSCAFVWSKAGALEPVTALSKIRLCDLKGYDDEKKLVVDNTLYFLDGKPAASVLLYGDRGTGKSSTVHALLNEFAPRGLRVIEVPKSRLSDLPKILELLKNRKNRFIVFLDDLSFDGEDDDFAELKAVLEGSVYKADNAVVYATTNRRHLVKETHARRGDEVHGGDAVEEILSLSDRFGLTVTYLSPAKAEFISILRQILADRGIAVDERALELRAERFALGKGGRSPRAARQLADLIECER